jgi:phosphocarrier protein
MTEDNQTTDLESEFAILQVVVKGDHGLHARPAGVLAKQAQSFEADIFLVNDGQKADAKSILDVLTLAAGPGDVVEIHARGEDADQALDTLRILFDRQFEE